MTSTKQANSNVSNGKSADNFLSSYMTLNDMKSLDRFLQEEPLDYFGRSWDNLLKNSLLSSLNFSYSSSWTDFDSLDSSFVSLFDESRSTVQRGSAEKNDLFEERTNPLSNETNNKLMLDYTAALSVLYYDRLITEITPELKVREAPTRKQNKVKHQLSKKPRRVIPENKEYIPEPEPTDLDVVGGRGGVSTHHRGNRRYWEVILAKRQEHRACGDDNKEKTQIARSIVDFVDNSGGRFLQKEKVTKRFYVLHHKVTMNKVKQALRDKYVPLWAC